MCFKEINFFSETLFKQASIIFTNGNFKITNACLNNVSVEKLISLKFHKD